MNSVLRWRSEKQEVPIENGNVWQTSSVLCTIRHLTYPICECKAASEPISLTLVFNLSLSQSCLQTSFSFHHGMHTTSHTYHFLKLLFKGINMKLDCHFVSRVDIAPLQLFQRMKNRDIFHSPGSRVMIRLREDKGAFH